MIIPAKSQFNWQDWLNSVQWFQRRFKCEKLTDRQMLSHDKKMPSLLAKENRGITPEA